MVEGEALMRLWEEPVQQQQQQQQEEEQQEEPRRETMVEGKTQQGPRPKGSAQWHTQQRLQQQLLPPQQDRNPPSLHSSMVHLAPLWRRPSIDSGRREPSPVASLEPSARKDINDEDDDSMIGEEDVTDWDVAARSADIAGRSKDHADAASMVVAAATITTTCATTDTENIGKNTDEMDAMTSKEDASGPIDDLHRDTLTDRHVKNAIEEAAWRKWEHQSKQRQRTLQRGQSLPGSAPTKTFASASSPPSTSAALAESPVARWPPVYPNSGSRNTRVSSITSPSSSAATATSTTHPLRFIGDISSPLIPPTDSAMTKADDSPLTIISSSSPSLGVRQGLTPPRPFDEALPARSAPIIPLSVGNGIAGLYLQRQTTDAVAAEAPSTSTASQRQRCLHQYHQAEPSPTLLDHAADNVAGGGSGLFRETSFPNSLKNPLSSALATIISSPRSVIQGINGENVAVDDQRRRIFLSTPIYDDDQYTVYDDTRPWRRERAERESSPTYLPTNLDLKLSKLHEGQQRSIETMINRALSFDSASASTNGSMNHSSVLSVAQSIQPSVESACVRQNFDFFHEMMEGEMMDFFAMPTPVRGSECHEQSIAFCDENDGPDDCWAGNIVRGLDPLAEEEEEGSIFDVQKTSYINVGKGEIYERWNDKYHYHCDPIEYTFLNSTCAKTEMQPPPQQQWHLETNEKTETSRGVGVNPPSSSSNDYIIPSLSQEYDDPSMFGNNSLISEGSDVEPLVATEAPPMESLGALLISSKKKDLAKFFDQVSENILSGCENYDDKSKSSDMFYIDDSHFWREEDDGLSEKSESKNGDEAPLSLTRAVPSNKTVPFTCNKIESGEEKRANCNEPRQSSRLQSQQKKTNSLSLATGTMTGTYSKTIPNLLPASSFLSTKQRDTTPVRANTSRTSVSNSGMTSIKEWMLEEFEGDSNIESHYEMHDSGEGYEKSHPCDQIDDILRAPDECKKTHAPSRDDTSSSGRSTAFCHIINRKVHTPEREGQGSVKRPDDLTAGFDFDFGENDHDKVKKMTSREKLKGHSLAWHSNNGVNDDEHYDSKQWPPSSSDRATRLANRLSLLSKSTHTETLRRHFFDDDHELRDCASSLYHPSYTSARTKGSLRFIQEERLKDTACSVSNNDDDNCSRDEDEYSLCYSHDDFAKEFKAILSQECGSIEGKVAEVKAQEMNVFLSGKETFVPSSLRKVMPDASSHDDPNTSHQFSTQNHQQYQGCTHSSSRDTKTYYGFNISHPLTTTGDRQNRLNNTENIGGSNGAHQNSKTSVPHPHHVPNEVTKSILEKKLRGLSDITDNVAKRDRGDNSVGTSELGSLFTRDSDIRHINLPVPRMIFHKTNPDTSAWASSSFAQNVPHQSLVQSKFAHGNLAMESNQHPLTKDDYYGSLSSQFSDFISSLFTTEQTILENFQPQSLPNSAIGTIEETDYKSAEAPLNQRTIHPAPRLMKDTENKLPNSIVTTERDLRNLDSSIFLISRQQRDKCSEKKNLVMDAVSSSRDNDLRSLSSSTTIQEVYNRFHAFDRPPKSQHSDRLDPTCQEFGGDTGQYPRAVELENRVSKFDAANSTSSKVEAAPLASDRAPSSSKEGDQFILLKTEKVFSARAFDMQIFPNGTIGADGNTVQSNDVNRHPTIAESNNSFPFPSQLETRSSVVVTLETKTQQPQIPKSYVKDDASHLSSIFEAFEVAPLRTFAHIGDINTIDDDTIVSLNDLGVHHAYVEPESYLDLSSQTSLYGVACQSGIQHGSAISTRNMHVAPGALYQHVVPSQENSKPLKSEPASPRQPPFSASMANTRSTVIRSQQQPRVNNADCKDKRQDVNKQRFKKGWRKLVMGGLPGISTHGGLQI